MPHPVAPDELVQQIPAFLSRVAELETHTPEGVADALIATTGLELGDRVGDGKHLRTPRYSYDNQASFERRLRSAITRVLGKPSGTDKHWDGGCATVAVHCGLSSISIDLQPQLSLANLRAAASAWLDGADLRTWLVESGFVAADAEPTPEGSWPRPKPDLVLASVHTTPEHPARIGFFLEPGIRPPGQKSSTDDERFDQILAYLTEWLGAADRPGWWHRGSRSFSIRRMRSYTRQIQFDEAPEGRVRGPHGVVTIPHTPAPEPHRAAELLRALAPLRGSSYVDAIAALSAAGLVTDVPARHRHGVATVLDLAGRPIDLGLVDQRFSSAVVEVTSAADPMQVAEPVFTEAFGPYEHHGSLSRWRLGPMVIGYAGSTGEDGFERLRASVTEDTADAVRAARSWLLAGDPLGDVRVHDAWHGRCLGAAVSAGAVPAVAAGRPVWRVDDRLLWLETDRLVGADAGGWPPWSAQTPEGAVSDPAPRAELAAFLDAVAGWREPTLDDAVATLVGLGWATADLDTISRPKDRYAEVRLRRPAGATFWAEMAEERLQFWKIYLARSVDPSAVAPVEQALRELLAPWADQDRGGWTLGGFQVRIPTGGTFVGGGRRLELTGRAS